MRKRKRNRLCNALKIVDCQQNVALFVYAFFSFFRPVSPLTLNFSQKQVKKDKIATRNA